MNKIAQCNRCFNTFEYTTTGGRPRESCDKCRNKDRVGAASVACSMCQKLFAPQRRRSNEHCSIECRRAAWSASRVLMSCKTCGQTISSKLSTADSVAYCTRRCKGIDRHARVATIGPEPPPVDNAMWIRLTNGYFALVDDDMYECLNKYTWSARDSEKACSVYAYRKTEHGQSISMHVQVMGRGEQTVDHIVSGNTLDNRRCNLRRATIGQQMMNRRKFAGYTSKYKGVHRSGNKFVAAIKHNGRQRRLGAFNDEIHAALAYDAAARTAFKEFARLNFPLPGEQNAIHVAN